jgi:hypothetical protein
MRRSRRLLKSTTGTAVEAVRPDRDGIEEVVRDKGYHSNQLLVDLEAVGIDIPGGRLSTNEQTINRFAC